MPIPPNRKPVIGINTRKLSTVKPKDMVWLWHQRIPLGKITVLSGDPDKGKTFAVLDIMARLSTGKKFIDGSYPISKDNERRESLWVSAEDEDDDTIVPRLIKLGADRSKVESLTMVWDSDGEQILDIEKHLLYLENWLKEHPNVSLVVLDPLPAFLGKRVDSYKNSEVRMLLTPLAKLAARCKVAIICINHLSKGETSNAIHRSMGSVAFVAAARSSWLVAEDPENSATRRYFAPIKGNLKSEKVAGLAFHIGPTIPGAIRWETCETCPSADEVLKLYQIPKENAPAKTEAIEWLKDLLKDGPVLASEVWEKVEADGMCKKTVKTAKKDLGIGTVKLGGSGEPWSWSLPKLSLT